MVVETTNQSLYMKAICKDYYKYSRDMKALELIRDSLNIYWGKRALAANKSNILVSALIRLSSDEDVDVRCCVAGNPNTPVEILEKLSKDRMGWVRECVNQNTSWTRHKEENSIYD